MTLAEAWDGRSTPRIQPNTLSPQQRQVIPRMRQATRESLQATLKLGERAFFVGHTGSGKTYLASKLLDEIAPPRLPVVVIDPKHMFETNAGSVWEVRDELPRRWEVQTRHPKKPRHLRIIIRPQFLEDMRHNEVLNATYERIFNAGKCLVYLDEIQALCYNSRASAALARLVQMGRQPRISVWGSTLRPSGIPRMFLSESDHLFVFRLRDLDDRKRMSEVIGPWGETTPGPGEHDFWYMPPGVAELEPVLVHQGS